MSATPSAVMRASSCGDGDRVGIGVFEPPEMEAEEEEAPPMERTRRSSTPVASGNSCLLWST
uniref:Uncharacterized protein n=1 Tax=Arundo donax TaxID=35708 RepID=A0A0A9B7W6_ARUDO